MASWYSPCLGPLDLTKTVLGSQTHWCASSDVMKAVLVLRPCISRKKMKKNENPWCLQFLCWYYKGEKNYYLIFKIMIYLFICLLFWSMWKLSQGYSINDPFSPPLC